MYRTALLLFCGLLTAACAESVSTDAAHDEAAYSSSQFEVKLACDGRAAVLDEDRNVTRVTDLERQAEIDSHALQFVVRDRGVVDYLSSRVDHIQNVRGEIILRGSLAADEAFNSFEDWSVGTPTVREEGRQVRVKEQVVGVVHRVVGETDKVRIVFNKTTVQSRCSTYFEEGHCAYDQQRDAPGQMTSMRSDAPIADWVFRCVAP